MSAALRAPFPYFGGKSRAAPLVWEAFGSVANYLEPFFGSGAVLLARPHEPGIETVNDSNCFISNFWRALQHAPEEVAHWADYPVLEPCLHARHLWLTNNAEVRERMLTEPDYFDAKVAGWWVWGASAWIGSGWCTRGGATQEVARTRKQSGRPPVQLPHLSDSGTGVHRPAPPHLVNFLTSGTRGEDSIAPAPSHWGGHEVSSAPSRQVPRLSAAGQGIHRVGGGFEGELRGLATRLRRVRVACGDWERVMGPSVTFRLGLTGVFLDPPYADGEGALYAEHDRSISARVARWAVENGANPMLRICLAGYEGEHDMPKSWRCVAWKAKGGYGNQAADGENDNAKRERLWFSPACLGVTQGSLFGGVANP